MSSIEGVSTAVLFFLLPKFFAERYFTEVLRFHDLSRSKCRPFPPIKTPYLPSNTLVVYSRAVFFFILYQVYPIVRVFIISFTDYHYLRNDPINWTGFLNYTNALNDPVVGEGLMRALTFTLMFLPGVIFVPLFLAILLTGSRRPVLRLSID